MRYKVGDKVVIIKILDNSMMSKCSGKVVEIKEILGMFYQGAIDGIDGIDTFIFSDDYVDHNATDRLQDEREYNGRARAYEENTNTNPFTEEEIEQMTGTDQFSKVTNSLAKLLNHKNKKYGNAALEPLNIFSGKTKVGQRLDDKLARVKNSEELRKNDVSDLMGYLVLTCIEKGWDNFDEFLD